MHSRLSPHEIHSQITTFNAAISTFQNATVEFHKSTTTKQRKNPGNEGHMSRFLAQGMNLVATQVGTYFSPRPNGREEGAPNLFTQVEKMIRQFNPDLLRHDLRNEKYIQKHFVRPEAYALNESIRRLHSTTIELNAIVFDQGTLHSDYYRHGKFLLVENPARATNLSAPKELVVMQVNLPSSRIHSDKDQAIVLASTKLNTASHMDVHGLRGQPIHSIESQIRKTGLCVNEFIEGLHAWVPEEIRSDIKVKPVAYSHTRRSLAAEGHGGRHQNGGHERGKNHGRHE